MATEKRVVPVELSSVEAGGLLAGVRVRCPESDCLRTGEHCSGCPKKVGWTMSTGGGELGLVCEIEIQTCASCGIALPGAPLFQAIVSCEECRELARDPINEMEIGAQD